MFGLRKGSHQQKNNGLTNQQPLQTTCSGCFWISCNTILERVLLEQCGIRPILFNLSRPNCFSDRDHAWYCNHSRKLFGLPHFNVFAIVLLPTPTRKTHRSSASNQKSVADFLLFVVQNQVLICADRLPQQHLLILLRDRICVTDARLHIEHSTNAHQRCTTGNDKNCTAKNLQQFFSSISLLSFYRSIWRISVNYSPVFS